MLMNAVWLRALVLSEKMSGCATLANKDVGRICQKFFRWFLMPQPIREVSVVLTFAESDHLAAKPRHGEYVAAAFDKVPSIPLDKVNHLTRSGGPLFQAVLDLHAEAST